MPHAPTSRCIAALSGSLPLASDAEWDDDALEAHVGSPCRVTGLRGALPKFTDKKNLELVASIAPIEAYHAAILRTLLYTRGLEMVTPYDIRVFDFVQVTKPIWVLGIKPTTIKIPELLFLCVNITTLGHQLTCSPDRHKPF